MFSVCFLFYASALLLQDESLFPRSIRQLYAPIIGNVTDLIRVQREPDALCIVLFPHNIGWLFQLGPGQRRIGSTSDKSCVERLLRGIGPVCQLEFPSNDHAI